MSTMPTPTSQGSSPTGKLLQSPSCDLELEKMNISSSHSSPVDRTQHLSPCALDSIEKVNSLKKDFKAGFEQIEMSIQKESTIYSSPTVEPSSSSPVINTVVENRCTSEAVIKDTVADISKPVKVEKTLFRDSVKPQRQVAPTSRLLQPTRSNSAKRVVSAKREGEGLNNQRGVVGAADSKPRCASAGVRKRPSTQAQAPTFMSRPSRPSNVQLTSEEMEFRRIEVEKKAAMKEMKKFQNTFQVLKTKGAIPSTVRSVKELTIPMTPCFPTDDGKRKRIYPEDPAEEKKVEVPKARSGPTVPAPFQFATTLRHGEGEKSHEDVPTSGESIENFTKNTRSTYVPKKAATGVTHPKGPIFRSEQRSNSVGRPKPLSRDELEQKEMEEAQAMSFKAKPVNRRIYDSMGVNGVPKVQVKQATTFSEFHLSCDDRAAYHEAHKPTETSNTAADNTHFKALEMPDFSKFSSQPRCSHPSPKLTEAHSPKLGGGKRASSAPARRQKMPHEDAERQRQISANAWKQKVKQRQELTNPIDMKLKTTERGKSSEQALKDRVRRQMMEEKRASEVHATPFNEKIFKKSFSVSASSKELTEFSEFKLQTDERHNEAAMKSMEAMQQSLKNNTEFHARPLPASTHKPGFKPSPSTKEPATPQNIHLSSERRSLARQSFDASVKKAKEEEKALKDKQLEAQSDKENFEISKLRRAPVSKGGMSFKATKVISKDPYPVKHVQSTPLTEPRSPNLQTALRTRVNE